MRFSAGQLVGSAYHSDRNCRATLDGDQEPIAEQDSMERQLTPRLQGKAGDGVGMQSVRLVLILNDVAGHGEVEFHWASDAALQPRRIRIHGLTDTVC